MQNKRATIDALNACGRAEFVAALGWIFEGSPWVAERAWTQRPFGGLDELHRAMVSEVARASREEQLTLLRAHPDLGTRARMSHASTGEQAAAGLGGLSRQQLEQLDQLNASYREKFGYPFLLAVKGRTPHQILDALARRLPREPHEEFAEALLQVERIARFRLEEILDS